MRTTDSVLSCTPFILLITVVARQQTARLSRSRPSCSVLSSTTASDCYVKPEVNLPEEASLKECSIWQCRQSNGQPGPSQRWRARRSAGNVARCRGDC